MLVSLAMLAAVVVSLLAFVGGATANDKDKEPPKPTATEGAKETSTPEEPKPTSTAEEPKPTATAEEPKPTATPKPPHGDKDDLDDDGCSTEEELGPDATHGGQRDPKNPWDFYDVNDDDAVTVTTDVLAVAKAFGPSSGPNYAVEKDRSPPPSAQEEPDPGQREPWDLGPPDGHISVVTDVLGVAKQFGHTCLK
jgi:hypothetical protein